MPVPDNEPISLVTCHQALQFVPDKLRALEEMRRVLRAGGRVALGTCRPLQDIPFLYALDRIAQQHLGPFIDTRHSFGDASELLALLLAAGFHDVTAETVVLVVKLPDGPLFARMNATAVVGMSPTGHAMDDAGPAQLATEVTAACAEVVQRYTKNGTLTFSLATNIVTART